jgi:hypothetical protein
MKRVTRLRKYPAARAKNNLQLRGAFGQRRTIPVTKSRREQEPGRRGGASRTEATGKEKGLQGKEPGGAVAGRAAKAQREDRRRCRTSRGSVGLASEAALQVATPICINLQLARHSLARRLVHLRFAFRFALGNHRPTRPRTLYRMKRILIALTALVAALMISPKPADSAVIVSVGPGYYAPGYYWGPGGYRYYHHPYWRGRRWWHHHWTYY